MSGSQGGSTLTGEDLSAPARRDEVRAGAAAWSAERWQRVRRWLRAEDMLVASGALRPAKGAGTR